MDWREFNNSCFTLLSGLLGGAFAVFLMIILSLGCLIAALFVLVAVLAKIQEPGALIFSLGLLLM
jgi:hypothetical protein